MAIRMADATAVLNLPLIDDHMAVRAVIYDDHRGGYIDNVPATFTRKDTDVGIHYADFHGRQWRVPGRRCQQRLLRTAGQPLDQQLQHRGPVHQSGDLHGHSGGAALQVQRRLERARHPVLPEHGRTGGVLSAAQRIRRRAAAAARGDPVQQRLRQGQVRKHRLDRQRQARSLERGLHGRLSRTQRRSDRRLHQLRARRVRRLLPVLRTARPGHVPHGCLAHADLLLTERRLAFGRAQHTHAARI